ncbi:IS1 family transposase, partial [Escherichia coli]|uniref:IS1 family transposase n=1 Tax=Escherichia coli TaxID=562 RepID=UPI0023D8FA8E
IVCAEMDEQWGYVGAKSRQRWLFYAYDRLRKTVVAHVFGERTMATLGRLMSLLSPFDVVIWMTDNGSCYRANETRQFARMLGLEPKSTAVRSPESNGIAESFV